MDEHCSGCRCEEIAAESARLQERTTYATAHARARKYYQGFSCVECGVDYPIHMALRIDVPPGSIRISEKGYRFSVADPEEAYIPLCAKHHHEYDPWKRPDRRRGEKQMTAKRRVATWQIN